jgi:hypothetical protein
MEYQDAVNILAGVVEQAKKDATSITLGQPHTCPIGYPHSPRKCAREFLAALNDELRGEPMKRVNVVELALQVAEVIE